MLVNDGSGSPAKPKSARQVSAEMRSRKKPSSRRSATFRGGKPGGKTLDDFKKAKAERDAKKKPPTTSTKSNVGSGKVSNKTQKKKGTKKPKKNRTKSPRPTPPPPAKVDPAPLVKTKQTGVPVLALAFSNNVVEQNRDILNAFLALSGTELFQYTNERSVDGMFNDVSIISVLSDRRKDYSPNDIIEQYPAFVTDVYKGSGADAGKLFFEVQGTTAGGSMMVEFYIASSVANIGSVDFV